MIATPPERSEPKPQTVYLDLTHLGRHVTGIERIAIELFENQAFAGAELVPVRSRGLFSMIIKQQLWLPLLALLKPSAKFVFPGFPPSPLFVLARHRTVLYVHDTFLISRRQDLSLKAKLYMAWPFRFAVTGLRQFLVNSEKTRGDLAAFTAPDASISLYRPSVRNVFGLASETSRAHSDTPHRIRVVSVGTVEPRKNYGAAAAIVAALDTLHTGGAELHIIGRAGWGPDAETLKQYPRVIVHGFLPADDVKRILQSADVYLCTSHDEGLGLPLIEAQYAGLPVVAPDQDVFREVLGDSALFIDPAATDQAAAKVLELLSQDGSRARWAAKAAHNVARWNGLAATDSERARAMFQPQLPCEPGPEHGKANCAPGS